MLPISMLDKNGYSFESRVKEIRCGKKIFQILKQFGLDNWITVIRMYRVHLIPDNNIKGIGEKTWSILIDMIAEEELYRYPYGRRALELAIDKACPENFVSARNVKAKIHPALRRLNIYTLAQLWGAPEYYIRDNRNIGPTMWASISKIIDTEVGSHLEHYDEFITIFDAANRSAAKTIEELGRWKRECNEKRNA